MIEKHMVECLFLFRNDVSKNRKTVGKEKLKTGRKTTLRCLNMFCDWGFWVDI